MAIISINWRPARRELRQFAGLWLGVFGLLGAWMLYQSGAQGYGSWVLAAAVALGVPGLVVPAILRPVYVTWMVLAFPIGWTVSHLLLGSIFYGVITPIGLLLRASGHDPMMRKFDRNASSYWIDHRTGGDPTSYLRQF